MTVLEMARRTANARVASSPSEEALMAEDTGEGKAAYMRRYRAARPEVLRRERTAATARARGLTRLAERYPALATRFINEERKRLGLPPLRGTR